MCLEQRHPGIDGPFLFHSILLRKIANKKGIEQDKLMNREILREKSVRFIRLGREKRVEITLLSGKMSIYD